MLKAGDAIAVGEAATGPRIVEGVGNSSGQETTQIGRAPITPAAPLHTGPDPEVVSPRPIQNEPETFKDNIMEVNCLLLEPRDYELEGSAGKDVNVKGNLAKHLDFWVNIGTSKFILDVIKDGYRLPFEENPEGAYLKNNKSALLNSSFVEESINELVHSERVLEVHSPPFVVNPLSVAVQSSGKKRLILDLRRVNQFLKKQKVKYEDWKVALSFFHKGAYMLSFDLKSGYHHIEIHPDYQRFLGFAWKFEGDRSFRYFVFTVLPFGLSTAPHIFTKVLKPLEKHWRIQGINMALFLDDGIILEENECTCKSVSDKIKGDLTRAGLVTNETKSIWDPQQCMQWLGLVWDSGEGTLRISEQRINNIKSAMSGIMNNHGVVSARELSSFVGKIISAGVVYGKVSRIMTRYCSISIAAAQDWDSKFDLDEYCMREIKFWERNVGPLNLRRISSDTSRKSHYIVCSDASGVGCGAHLDLDGEQVCNKQWEDCERLKSSTWRELSAIEFGLESFLPIISNGYVKWFSDSQTACRIIEVGSMKRDLHVIATRVFQRCASNNIQLDIQWLPRTELERADYISRLIDVDDWQLSNTCFECLEEMWGPHSIDCFANFYNKKLSRFYSRFWNPGCEGVDFFVQKVHGENCLVVPPVDMIGKALNYLFVNRAQCTLVVPSWPSSYFWPIITKIYGYYVTGHKVFEGSFALRHGQNTNSLLGSDRYKGEVLALHLDFRNI